MRISALKFFLTLVGSWLFASTALAYPKTVRLIDQTDLTFDTAALSVQRLGKTLPPNVIALKAAAYPQGIGFLSTETLVDGTFIFCQSKKILDGVCYEQLANMKPQSQLLKIQVPYKKHPQLRQIYSVYYQTPQPQRTVQSLDHSKSSEKLTQTYVDLLKSILKKGAL